MIDLISMGSVQHGQFVSLFNEVELVQNFKPTSSIQVFFSLQTYVVIGHTADQTHFTEGQTGKAMQGSWAMDVIDTDRLQMASEAGYTQVTLTKLHPPECTPKNNLLIGRFWSFSILMERSKDGLCWFLNGTKVETTIFAPPYRTHTIVIKSLNTKTK